MYPDVTRIPGWQAQARWKKHDRSCMGTFSRRFNVSSMLCQYTAAVFLQFLFDVFCLHLLQQFLFCFFRSCSESESSMADDLEKIREKNEAGG